MSDIVIQNIDGADVVQYQPKGVCAKMMQVIIKDNIIQDVNFVGGCNGNLKGIAILVKNMHINEVVSKLKGLPCGSRPTSCPDQLTKCIEAYVESKEIVKA